MISVCHVFIRQNNNCILQPLFIKNYNGPTQFGLANKIGKCMFPPQFATVCLHFLRVELHCKLQEKLHRVTGPLRLNGN